MPLPDLKYDYAHSTISGFSIGPRREVTLFIQILEWNGQSGLFSPAKPLRFGGIINFDEVQAFFRQSSKLELAYLRYSTERHSKLGSIFFELYPERTASKLIIHCRTIHLG